MKLLPDAAWPIAIAFSCALASFASTRGPDGSPLLAIAIFPCIGIVYGVSMWTGNQASLAGFCIQLPVFLAATCLPFLVPPRLEEMGGILYYAIPALTVLNSIVGAFAVLVVRPRLARRSAP